MNAQCQKLQETSTIHQNLVLLKYFSCMQQLFPVHENLTVGLHIPGKEKNPLMEINFQLH